MNCGFKGDEHSESVIATKNNVLWASQRFSASQKATKMQAKAQQSVPEECGQHLLRIGKRRVARQFVEPHDHELLAASSPPGEVISSLLELGSPWWVYWPAASKRLLLVWQSNRALVEYDFPWPLQSTRRLPGGQQVRADSVARAQKESGVSFTEKFKFSAFLNQTPQHPSQSSKSRTFSQQVAVEIERRKIERAATDSDRGAETRE